MQRPGPHHAARQQTVFNVLKAPKREPLLPTPIYLPLRDATEPMPAIILQFAVHRNHKRFFAYANKHR
ncbi:hypothetical protein NCHU2750_20410 [Neorhizobium sp. NCHU2750]|nr:hypothetical protein NCHU2750_20410 [Neorhizobium sp. NCHU2750]